MAFPPSNALSRAAKSAPMPPMPMAPSAPPDPTPPGDAQDPAGQGQSNDVQIITAAAQNDPVIAAIAHVLGIA